MKKLTKGFLLISTLCLSVFAVAHAQVNSVHLKFEVDGKPINKPFKVQIYIQDKVIEPLIAANSFEVPPEIESVEKVSVRFLCGKYNLFFDPVYAPKFKAQDWVVGVDTKPFDPENYTQTEDKRKPKVIHYIEFNSTEGDGTRLVVSTFK